MQVGSPSCGTALGTIGGVLSEWTRHRGGGSDPKVDPMASRCHAPVSRRLLSANGVKTSGQDQQDGNGIRLAQGIVSIPTLG